MPRRDGTGPWGMGPLTGRGFGPCGLGLGFGYGFRRGGWGRGFRRPGFRRGPGYGFGYGYGYEPGYGYGWGVEGAVSSAARREFLKEQKELLKGELALIEQELEAENDD